MSQLTSPEVLAMRDLIRYGISHNFQVSFTYIPSIGSWTVETGRADEDDPDYTVSAPHPMAYAACELGVVNIRAARAAAGNPIAQGEDGAEEAEEAEEAE